MQVEDGGVRLDDHDFHVAEQLFQPVALPRQGVGQRGEGAVLAVFDGFEADEGEPLEELLVLLDGPAEEVADADDVERLAVGRPLLQEPSEVAVADLAHLLGHLQMRLVLRLDETFRVAEAGEDAGAFGQLARLQGAAGQQAGLVGGAQLVEDGLAEFRLAGQHRQRRGVEEGADLQAERAVLGAGDEDLAALPEGVAGQGDLHRLPGALVRLLQGLGEPLAVVDELGRQEIDDLGAHHVADLVAERLQSQLGAGPIDHVAQGEGGEMDEDAHGEMLRCGCE